MAGNFVEIGRINWMGIFSDLSKFGLDELQNAEVYEEKKTEKTQASETPVKVLEEKDFLYEKEYTCVVCDQKFTNLSVRNNKLRLVKQDQDLRPRYEVIDPLKYDVVSCPHCGYSAISKCYNALAGVQRKMLKEKIGANFQNSTYLEDTITYDEAVLRHKLALACSIVKQGKNSERAYTCLKLGWMLESLMEDIPDNNWKHVKYSKEVEECMQNAYDGFKLAFSSEEFPICGMNEHTMTLLIAQLGRRLGDDENAKRMAGMLITNRNVPDRIKELARDLKSQIDEESK